MFPLLAPQDDPLIHFASTGGYGLNEEVGKTAPSDDFIPHSDISFSLGCWVPPRAG